MWLRQGNDSSFVCLSRLPFPSVAKSSVERFGMEKGSHATLRALVRNAEEQGLSDEMIGRIAGLDAARVHNILRNEPVDLPPHLLSAAGFRASGPEAR